MNLEQATHMVEYAIEQRKKWGKNYTHGDLDPVFLDALVVVEEERKTNNLDVSAALKAAEDAKLQHDQIVLLNRQLGAAKSRETSLRQKLAALGNKSEETASS